MQHYTVTFLNYKSNKTRKGSNTLLKINSGISWKKMNKKQHNYKTSKKKLIKSRKGQRRNGENFNY